MATDVLLLSSPAMRRHNPGAGHVERPERLDAILSVLGDRVISEPAPASRAVLERVHDPAYVDSIERLRGRPAVLDADTTLSAGSVDAAFLAAGAAVDLVDALVTGAASRGFALVRPPGHHAERQRAMGFCVFNNIAVAAAHAVASHGMERVLVIDWDVHHGNGTQHVFERRRDVLVIDVHQDRLFPDSGGLDEHGLGDAAGFTVNAPLPPGIGDAGYISLFERLVVPIANSYRPQLVLVSAGFDAHRDDPLGGMLVTTAGFAAMCAVARQMADQHASGRLGLLLEGGYHLEALASSVLACVRELDSSPAGAQVRVDSVSGGDSGHPALDVICEAHQAIWPAIQASGKT